MGGRKKRVEKHYTREQTPKRLQSEGGRRKKVGGGGQVRKNASLGVGGEKGGERGKRTWTSRPNTGRGGDGNNVKTLRTCWQAGPDAEKRRRGLVAKG